MRFNCGACGYEFSTVRGAPREDEYHVVDDFKADAFWKAQHFAPLSDGAMHGASVLEAMEAVPVFECPQCHSLVFPYGRRGTRNDGQPVETFKPSAAPGSEQLVAAHAYAAAADGFAQRVSAALLAAWELISCLRDEGEVLDSTAYRDRAEAAATAAGLDDAKRTAMFTRVNAPKPIED